MYQGAQFGALIHSPDSDSTHVPIDGTSEGEGVTKTGGRSCSELSSNITWRVWKKNLIHRFVALCNTNLEQKLYLRHKPHM